MEFPEMQQRLTEIHQKLLVARETAEAGIILVDRLILDLAHELGGRKDMEEHDGGSEARRR